MQTENLNIQSGYRYKGGNALILTQAMAENGWQVPHWATAAQAEKLERKTLPGMNPVQVVHADRTFSVFNTAQLTAASVAPAPAAAPAPDPAPAPAAIEPEAETEAEPVPAALANAFAGIEPPAFTPYQSPARQELANKNLGFIVRPDFLKAAATMAHTDATRAYLCAVYVHLVHIQGAPFIEYIATDGHRLACLQHAALDSEDMPAAWGNGGYTASAGMIVPAAIIARIPSAGKKCKPMEEYVHLLESPEAPKTKVIVAFVNGDTLTGDLIDACYPDFERVIPTNNNAGKGVCVTFNAKYLASFSKLANSLEIDSLNLGAADDNHRPFSLSGFNRKGWRLFGVLMPLRGDYTENTIRRVDREEAAQAQAA